MHKSVLESGGMLKEKEEKYRGLRFVATERVSERAHGQAGMGSPEIRSKVSSPEVSVAKVNRSSRFINTQRSEF